MLLAMARDALGDVLNSLPNRLLNLAVVSRDLLEVRNGAEPKLPQRSTCVIGLPGS